MTKNPRSRRLRRLFGSLGRLLAPPFQSSGLKRRPQRRERLAQRLPLPDLWPLLPCGARGRSHRDGCSLYRRSLRLRFCGSRFFRDRGTLPLCGLALPFTRRLALRRGLRLGNDIVSRLAKRGGKLTASLLKSSATNLKHIEHFE